MFSKLFNKHQEKQVVSEHSYDSVDVHFEYKLVRTNRRSVSIQIDRFAKVIVRANHQTNPSKINQFLGIKQAWIAKKREEILSLQKTIETELDSKSYPVLGDLLPLIETANSSVHLNPGDSIIIPSGISDAKVIELLNQWKRDASIITFTDLFWDVYRRSCDEEPQLKKYPVTLAFRKMTRAWGNCRGNRITLNTALYHYPIHLVEYVICHEIAHLIHKNHGPHFYTLQTILYPNWKEAKKELNNLSIAFQPYLYNDQPKVV